METEKEYYVLAYTEEFDSYIKDFKGNEIYKRDKIEEYIEYVSPYCFILADNFKDAQKFDTFEKAQRGLKNYEEIVFESVQTVRKWANRRRKIQKVIKFYKPRVWPQFNIVTFPDYDINNEPKPTWNFEIRKIKETIEDMTDY